MTSSDYVKLRNVRTALDQGKGWHGLTDEAVGILEDIADLIERLMDESDRR